MPDFIFSYGTLQNEKVQQSLLGRVLSLQSDNLIGYKSIAIEITDNEFLSKGESPYQHTLVKSGNPNDIIPGSVLEITNEELLIIDNYEPRNYKRIQVILQSGKKAWIYVASEN